jgi:hypothetical protein
MVDGPVFGSTITITLVFVMIGISLIAYLI